MAVLNMTAVAEALKSFYLPGLRYQLNDKASAFLAQLERDTESVVGKDIIMAMRYGRQGGIGNRADDGTLPTPNSRKTKQAKWETKNLFARFQISDKTIQASRSNVGAFANMLEQEIKDAETDAKLDLSRQALGNGIGTLATITAASHSGSSLTLTLDTVIYFAEGMYVDIIDVSATPDAILTNGEALEVATVNRADKQVVLTTSNNISGDIAANNDFLVVSGNHGLELTGVKAVFENTTLYGLTRATYPWLNANRTDVSGELSELDIQEAIDKADITAGAITNFLLCSHGVRRSYQNLLTAQKQLVNTLDLKGGWKALSYNGIPLVADKYVLAGKLYCLDLADWKMYQMSDYNWLDEEGSMLHRVSDKPIWEATLCKYADIGCGRPAGQVELYGITEH